MPNFEEVFWKAAAGPVSPQPVYCLSGQLVVKGKDDKSSLVLTVPASLISGLFDALQVVGASAPSIEKQQLTNGFLVMTPEELKQVGGPDKITERGHRFTYSLGRVSKVSIPNPMGQAYFVRVHSPDLTKLRVSYGLKSKYPRGGKGKSLPFHILFGFVPAGIALKSASNFLVSTAPTALSQTAGAAFSDLLNKHRFSANDLTNVGQKWDDVLQDPRPHTKRVGGDKFDEHAAMAEAFNKAKQSIAGNRK